MDRSAGGAGDPAASAACSLLGRAGSASGVWPCPFTSTSSRYTLGGGELVAWSFGSNRASPFTVEKQTHPPLVFSPAGQNPLEHSSAGMPSLLPNARGCRYEPRPAATSVRSDFLSRSTPRLVPSHRNP